MLKRAIPILDDRAAAQPPSGGCVLKLPIWATLTAVVCQPPSGGCVLKPPLGCLSIFRPNQPPSGGCVLKQRPLKTPLATSKPAAFRRLCVETKLGGSYLKVRRPAAFRRLCVETLALLRNFSLSSSQPPSGGCVLKP